MSAIRIEAESMALLNYQIESGKSPASGNAVISLYGGSPQGSATSVFPGISGLYDVTIGYFDENDGQSSVSLQIGDDVASWQLDQKTKDGGISSKSFVERAVFKGIQVNAGESIALSAIANAAEFARIDYIQFIPSDRSAPQLPPDSQLPSPQLGNVIRGGARNSSFNGTSGIDTVSYAQATGGVVADLGTGTAQRSFAPSGNKSFKIMPLGDSITYGVINSKTQPFDTERGGYRIHLSQKFANDGIVNAIDFVGSQKNGPETFDRNHEGYRGKPISYIAGKVKELLQKQDPDMVLLLIGTNDMRQSDAGSAHDRLSSLLDKIAQQSPDTHVLVGSLPPIPRNETEQKNATAYNQKLPDIIASKAAQGKRVSFVDINRVVSTNDIADGVHPTDAGYAKMADAWYDWIAGGQDSLNNIENLVGSAYNDALTGNSGVNTLKAGGGNDRLFGAGGDDVLYGDAGQDTFVLAPGNGTDTIADFKVGTDLIGLANGLSFSQVAIAQGNSSNDTIIRLAGTNEALAVLNGVSPNAINASSFIAV